MTKQKEKALLSGIMARLGAKGGRARTKSMTPAQRRRVARLGGKARQAIARAKKEKAA